MAKYKGPYKFTGTLYGVTGIQTTEGTHLRAKQQILKEQYKTAPQYEAFRRNGQLMKTGAQWSQALRTELQSHTQDASDKRMYARLNAAMRAIASAREEGLAKIKGFPFHNIKPLYRFFEADFTFEPESCTLHLPALHPGSHFNAPAAATHAQITLIAVGCDFESGSFTAAANDSALIPLDGPAQPLTLQVEKHYGQVPAELFLLRVSFTEHLNGKHYKMGAYMDIIETASKAAGLTDTVDQ